MTGGRFEPRVIGSGRGRTGTGGPVPPLPLLMWVAFMAAVLLYGVAGFALAGRVDASAPAVPRWLFPAAALLMTVMAVFAPRFLGGRAPANAPGPRTVDPGRLIAWAFDEAVALLGLVSVLVGAPTSTLVLYLLASWALLWLHRPVS